MRLSDKLSRLRSMPCDAAQTVPRPAPSQAPELDDAQDNDKQQRISHLRTLISDAMARERRRDARHMALITYCAWV